jgi:hypothetical protein
MRNAKAQRRSIRAALPRGSNRARRMSVMRRLWARSENHDGQRCALLTTKSRNTCTRATVFNSSG